MNHLTRRELLRTAGCGFGALALAGICQHAARGAMNGSPLAARPPMFAARAKRVIFIFMQGGPSHVDSFDHKPQLIADHGKSIDFTGVRFNSFGKQLKEKLMRPLWKFRQYGQTGAWVSELFPEIARHVDELCFLHGMHTEGVAHGPATLFLHTGATSLVRPSVGAWISYGLGTENDSLPAFVTVGATAANGGPRNYDSAFLPTIHQATTLGRAGEPSERATIRNLRAAGPADAQRTRYDRLRRLQEGQLAGREGDDELEAVIESYELAYRMQREAPDVLDLRRETAETLGLYGIDRPETADFGRQCLLARRLAESGVRYIQVSYSDNSANPRWDQHSNMPKHLDHARATDRPVAGLLADLKRRGLLEDTLVWWGGEFGRTPFSQGNDGRDHNPRGFTLFLAGGGVRPGLHYGETDEIGHEAVQGRVHMRDLHATLLHLLGMDHERLTFRHGGRDFRLTDIGGRVVPEILS